MRKDFRHGNSQRSSGSYSLLSLQEGLGSIPGGGTWIQQVTKV